MNIPQQILDEIDKLFLGQELFLKQINKTIDNLLTSGVEIYDMKIGDDRFKIRKNPNALEEEQFVICFQISDNCNHIRVPIPPNTKVWYVINMATMLGNDVLGKYKECPLIHNNIKRHEFWYSSSIKFENDDSTIEYEYLIMCAVIKLAEKTYDDLIDMI